MGRSESLVRRRAPPLHPHRQGQHLRPAARGAWLGCGASRSRPVHLAVAWLAVPQASPQLAALL
eukprot:8710554-Alexandrium_andersonii.AAC.1